VAGLEKLRDDVWNERDALLSGRELTWNTNTHRGKILRNCERRADGGAPSQMPAGHCCDLEPQCVLHDPLHSAMRFCLSARWSSLDKRRGRNALPHPFETGPCRAFALYHSAGDSPADAAAVTQSPHLQEGT
jgi:hypothetical protein